MADPIAFYFDFSSPYGYLAAMEVDKIAEATGREISWHPILLGVLFKLTGQRPLMQDPIRGPYFVHDMKRSAKRIGVPLVWPEPAPFPSQAVCRAYYWLLDQNPAQAVAFATATYKASFADGRNVMDRSVIADIATSVEADPNAVLAAINDPMVKDGLRQAVEAAVEKKIFGSPTFLVGQEMFWGHDRISHLIDFCNGQA